MFAIAMAGIEPGCMIYDKLMRGFIWRKYKVKVPDFGEELSNICWGCGRDPKDIYQNQNSEMIPEKVQGAKVQDTSKDRSLKTCSRCGVARYSLSPLMQPIKLP